MMEIGKIKEIKDLYKSWKEEENQPFDPNFPMYQTIVNTNINAIKEVCVILEIDLSEGPILNPCVLCQEESGTLWINDDDAICEHCAQVQNDMAP